MKSEGELINMKREKTEQKKTEQNLTELKIYDLY